jgi:TetR/AcrR family transcriptional regulator, regulator of biofilm formation and stress response
VAEHGIAGASHRRIATAAGVPLGSTTYYFPSLQDLVGEALALAAEMAHDDLRVATDELARGRDVVAVLCDMCERYLADRPRAIVEYELYVGAAREPAFHDVARVWAQFLSEALAPVVGEPRARALTMLVDGALLQALVLDQPLDRPGLEAAIAAIVDAAQP